MNTKCTVSSAKVHAGATGKKVNARDVYAAPSIAPQTYEFFLFFIILYLVKLTSNINNTFVNGLEEDTTRDGGAILAASVSMDTTMNKDSSGKLITSQMTCAACLGGFMVDVAVVQYMDTATVTVTALVCV